MELTFMWIVITAVIVLGLVQLFSWTKKNDAKPAWWVWGLGAVGLLLVLMAIQHYFGTIEEMYPTAAWMGALIFIVPGIILMALFGWRLSASKS
ncbi:MAG: dehalogenase [Dehalogenimonas sp.]